MGKISNIVFSFLFVCVLIFLVMEGLTLFSIDYIQLIIDDGFGVYLLFLLTAIVILTWVSYLVLELKPYGLRLIYGGLTGVFAGLGIHWLVYAAVTTLHSMSIHPVSGYFMNSLDISIRILPLVIGVAGILLYEKIPVKSNIRIYVVISLISYSVFPILIFFWSVLHPWLEVILFNFPLFFLLSKKDWIKAIK